IAALRQLPPQRPDDLPRLCLVLIVRNSLRASCCDQEDSPLSIVSIRSEHPLGFASSRHGSISFPSFPRRGETSAGSTVARGGRSAASSLATRHAMSDAKCPRSRVGVAGSASERGGEVGGE